MMRRLAALAFAFGFLVAFCASALAHAYLVESSPLDGDLLKQAPAAVELVFNEPVEVISAARVDPAGSVERLEAGAERRARVRLSLPLDLAPGSHLVSWRVISQDGHTVAGSLVFSVGRASGERREDRRESTLALSALSAPLVGARFFLLAGLIFGVGAVVFQSLFAPVAQARRLALGALACGGLAAFASIGLQGADAHGQTLGALMDRAMWRSGLRLPQGVGAAVAMAAVCVAVAALLVTRVRGRGALAALALALATLALVWSGHARLWRPEALMPALVALHVASAIVWAGALAPLAIATGAADFPDTLRRFSRFAPFIYATLAASGAGLATAQFLGPRDALETAWGVALAAKLALFAVVTLFAALNRWLYTRPALAGDAGVVALMRRSIRIEAMLVLAILAVAACWRLAPPPTALGPPDQRAFQIHVHGAQAMASVTIRPARVGPVQIRIEPKAADLSPLRVQEVDVFLTPDAPGLAAIQRRARLVSGVNVWETESVIIPAAGTWRLRVDLLVDDFERARLDAVIVLQP
jgi:copper transport protein